jgi:hypothetical protein
MGLSHGVMTEENLVQGSIFLRPSRYTKRPVATSFEEMSEGQ